MFQAKVTFVLLICLYLSGCTFSPYINDLVNNPKRVEFDDQEQIYKVSYMARYLLESDERAELEAELSKSELVERWGVSEYSTLTSMAVDTHVGKIGSSSGKTIGSTVFVTGVLLGEIFDGQWDQVGQVYLPKELHGVALDSKESAESALSGLLSDRVNQFAERFDYRVSCVQMCDSLNQIFLLTTDKKSNPSFTYWPQEIAISTYVKGLKRAEPDALRDAVLGFPVAWNSDAGESLKIITYSDPHKDDKGDIEIRQREYQYVGWGHDLAELKIGREIRLAIFDNPYLVLGDSDSSPGVVYFNRGIYSFMATHRPVFVKYKLTEPKLRK